MRRTRAPSKAKAETKAKQSPVNKPARRQGARPRAVLGETRQAAARGPDAGLGENPIEERQPAAHVGPTPQYTGARTADEAEPVFNPVMPAGAANPHRLGRARGRSQQPRLYGVEVEVVRDFIRACIRNALTFDATIKMGAKHVPPLSRAQVKWYWQDVRHEMTEDLELTLIDERAVQVQQLQHEIHQLRTMLDPKKPVQYVQIQTRLNAARELLAKLTGTLAPIEMQATVGVDVRITSASMQLFGDMTAEQLDRYVEMGRSVQGP